MGRGGVLHGFINQMSSVLFYIVKKNTKNVLECPNSPPNGIHHGVDHTCIECEDQSDIHAVDLFL